MRNRIMRAIAIAALLTMSVQPVAAGDGLSATLDGKHIRLDSIGDHSCYARKNSNNTLYYVC